MVVPCLQRMVFNYAVSILFASIAFPLIGPPKDASEPTVAIVVGSLIFSLVAEDLIFYWSHRLMHRYVYWIHKVHHEHTTPIALSGAYMHWLDQQIIMIGVLAPLVILRSHWKTWWLWLFLRNWETAEEHCGYDFPWNPTRLLPFYEGPAFHDFHHSKFNYNYAAVFSIWDRLFGTINPDYDRYHANLRFHNSSDQTTKSENGMDAVNDTRPISNGATSGAAGDKNK